MASPLNTVLSTVAVGNREQLSDIVSRITPEDTPIYTMAGKDKVIAGSFTNTLQATAARVLPETTKAELHRKQSEPGSANR